MEGNLKWGCGITRVSGRREVGGMWEFFVRETGCKTIKLRFCRQHMVALNLSSLAFLQLFPETV